MSSEIKKVYQGVRVKITVKELLKNRRAHQNTLTEYSNSWYQHAAGAPFFSLLPELSSQPFPCEDNSSDYGMECHSLFSDNFNTIQQREPAAYIEQLNSTYQEPWSLGVRLHQDCRDEQDSWTSMHTSTLSCATGNTPPLDNRCLPPTLFEYSEPVDATYISLHTNVIPHDNSAYSNCRPIESSPCLQHIGYPDGTNYYGSTSNSCYRSP
ncbi:hypothetical protein DPEC_G00234450 [Dallia pectoralis]|uniref:Uncharacterized protein n=1 Tax=Dallia pectoralis TaxID=75939 RepID=A0ACC2FXX6_DALPE|nr:hypothetical protein DPEC_G00234450 [Dallia pectoralis]